MKVLMIQRAERYSPNSVERDKAILEAVAERLCRKGHQVETVSEEALPDKKYDVIFTMGRLPKTLARLKTLDAKIINSPEGVENCTRFRLQTIMERIGTPTPPRDGADGYWLKRGDAAAQEPDDVVYASGKESLERAIAAMRQRGINDYTVSAHVKGDVVKFYGVMGTGFFSYFYPTDDGVTKFGDERHNGPASHYPFDASDLQHKAERLAEAVGIEVYGGDCIVREDGSFCIIDFNDWPSFSRCREEAAEAIASLISPDFEGMGFKELLKVSFKSEDTEEWLDVHFTRPIGLAFALLWNKFNIHPNVITIVSFFFGAGAGWMFQYTDLPHNIWGVLLLMLGNFCDSTDGQMARLTGKKTLVGRVLDGFSENVWFFCIYIAIVVRLWNQNIPGTEMQWGIFGFILCAVAGFLCHSPQCSLADYYRQIHLYFLLGKEGSELDTYAQQRQIYENLPKNALFSRVFYFNYANYCKSQERRTPFFQTFIQRVRTRWPHAADIPQPLRQSFRSGSLPLMKYTNLLTFNARAIILYVACLMDCPWVYPLAEITVFQLMYVYMQHTHESLCRRLISTSLLTPI